MEITGVWMNSNSMSVIETVVILLLLDSVWKHGDDWELVTQNVQTKSKLDCILKLNELPFGELMFSSKHKSNVPPFSGALTFLERLMIERLILLPHFYFVVFR
jgi:hypothetical protein